VVGKRVRNRAILLHLDHQRDYKTQAEMQANRAIRDEVAASRRVWCPDGIHKRPAP
jgi:hypothetical protein